jgi:hypothetical protein
VARPKLALFAPQTLFAGAEHVIEFELTPDQAMTVDYIEARLLGKQGWQVGSGKSKVANDVVYPTLNVRLMERGVLPPAATRFAVRFTLPRDVAPTHDIDPAYAHFDFQVRVGIPWWFDVKYRYVLPVRVPPPPTVERTPFAIRSTPASAPSDKPRIEISLASTRLIAGELVAGACAVFHLDDDKPRTVALTLSPNLALFGNRPRRRTGGGYTFEITLPAGSGGTSVPFSFHLPAQLTPTFTTTTHALTWSLLVRSGSFFGGKVEAAIPLDIVDQSAAATTPRLTEAPRLADERVSALFSRFATQRGWESTRLDEDDDRAAIERVAGDSTLRMSYAYRPEGTFLVARVVTRSLGLGLSVTPSSALRHVFWRDIEVDIAAWDRAHHVTARFTEQTVPPLRTIVPTLLLLQGLGTLVRWTDDEIVFERPSGDLEQKDLVATASGLEVIATALDVARAAIAPPPNVTVDLAKWHELARSLDGTLVVGDLSIDGSVRAGPARIPVELGLELDEDHRPIALYAIAGNPDDAKVEARAIKLSLPRPAGDVLGANIAEALVEPLTRWPADFIDLEVVDGTASARWRFLTGHEPLAIEAARASDLVNGLVTVLAALDPGSGPYR